LGDVRGPGTGVGLARCRCADAHSGGAPAKAGRDAFEAEQSIKDLATASLRMEVLGLLLIGFGSIVSVLPFVFDWR
jgi:hypothetical protein